MTRFPLRALAGALLAAAVTGTLLTSAITSPADAATPRPAVGDCHSLSFSEYGAASDPDPRISCERAHTSRTIAVEDVPGTSFRSTRAIDAAATRVCFPALHRATSTSEHDRLMAAYGLSYFIPTRAQLDEGARWIRCDIVLRGGNRLLALPTDKSPALGTAPHPTGVTRCAQVSDTVFRITACSVRHNYRAKGTVRVAGTDYPGDKHLNAIAARKCPTVARTKYWYATWPSRYGWSDGERRVLCYGYTTR